MLKKRVPIVLAAAAALLLASAPPASATLPDQAQRQVTVASYNVYLGGNIAPLLSASNLPVAAATLWAEVLRSNFPARADAIAALIAADGPAVVGLQEVALWEVTATGTTTQLGTFDYLATLLTALGARGAPYRAVATSTNFVSPPVPLGNGTSVTYSDRDVILVRADLPTSQLKVLGTDDGTFDAVIPIPSLGLEVIRGWASADLKLRGKTYRFVNTHLEAFDSAPFFDSVRNDQAEELAALLEDSPHPVVLVGDLNDDPLQGGGALEILAGALGLSDAWTLNTAAGFTSGQDLYTAAAEFDRRIDFVLYEADGRPSLQALEAHLIGEVPADRSPLGLWPSDHAGVVATLDLGTP